MAEEAKKLNQGVLDAIRAVGSQFKLAELLDVSQPAVWHFLHEGISGERAIQIEKVTGVAKEKIRPDLFEKL